MPHPSVLLSICFCLGIILAPFFSVGLFILSIATALLILVLLLLRKTGQLFLYLLLLTMFVFGVTRYQIQVQPPPEHNVYWQAVKGKATSVIGIVVSDPQLQPDQTRCIVQISGIATTSQDLSAVSFKGATGRIQLTVKSQSGTLPMIRYGDQLLVTGRLRIPAKPTNPGQLNYGDITAQKDINAQLTVYSQQLRVLSHHRGNWFKSKCFEIKHKLLTVHTRTLKPPWSNLMGGIIFGSSASPLPEEMNKIYRRAGVSHLLVVSGSQIAILVGTILALCRSFGLPIHLAVIITTIFNIAFTIITGADPSITRACIMAQLALCGLLLERGGSIYITMSVTIMGMLLWNPLMLFNAGFILSFAATFALVYVAPVLEEILSRKKIPRWAIPTLAISLAPWLMTTPISLFYFHGISLVSILANLIVVTWVEILVTVGFATTLVGLLWLPLAQVMNNFNWLLMYILNTLMTGLAGLPLAYLNTLPPSIPMIVGYYLFLFWGIERSKRRKPLVASREDLLIIILGIIVLVVLHFISIPPGEIKHLSSPPNLIITVLDVGQGDCLYIESTSGRNVLIDAGDAGDFNQGERTVLPFLQTKGVNKIDVLVVTHGHADHIGGAVQILKALPVGLVIEPGFVHPTYLYNQFLKTVSLLDIPYKKARRGQILDLGDNIKLTILLPGSDFITDTRSDVNNNSLVLLLQNREFSMLLPGDLEMEGEEVLLKAYPAIRAQVLKCGHHGSDTSSSPELLRVLKPRIAIISCGRRNRYGHPHQVTLDKLNQLGIRTYRTDRQGAITIQTNGKEIVVETVLE